MKDWKETGTKVILPAILIVCMALGAGYSALAQEEGEGVGPERLIKRWDKDGDGTIAKEEWGGRVPFERLDRNSDGSVTILEVRDLYGDFRRSKDPAHQGLWVLIVKAWDVDLDGRIVESEWKGSTAFADLDANGDKVLEASEAVGSEEDRSVRLTELWTIVVATWDMDGNGTLSEGEWQGSSVFENVDRNKDGVVSETDFVVVASVSGSGRPAEPEIFQEASVEPAPQSGQWEMMVKAMDSDGDTIITQEEWSGAVSAFERYDKNGDGSITFNEVE